MELLTEDHSVLGGITAGLTKLHVHVCGAECTQGPEQQNQPQLHVALSLCWARATSSPASPGQPPALQVSPQRWPGLLRLVQT